MRFENFAKEIFRKFGNPSQMTSQLKTSLYLFNFKTSPNLRRRRLVFILQFPVATSLFQPYYSVVDVKSCV